MSAAKHTPGPWTAMLKPAPSREDHGWRAMAMCGSRWMVAAPYKVAFECWDSEANARAMSATPDLLQAAEQFLASVKDGNVADLIDYYADIFGEAVAKATGSAS